MRASQLITLQIYHDNQWIDYTDGLINIEIIRGVEQYTGPLSQPDVGQLTIKSRNANLDPYNNNNIKYNSKIRVNAGSVRIFTGRIEGIQVEYGPKTEPTVVTINAFDLIGTMYKHILSESFIDNRESWSTIDLLGELSVTGEVAEWQNYIINTDGTLYSEGPIQSGTTVFDALNTRVKTDLGFYFANARNEIEYYRRDNDDAQHPFNSRAAEVTFDYNGNGESYKSISLNDGFEKIVNEVVITGVGNTDTTKVVVTADDSISLWGKSSASVNLATDDNTNLQNIGNKILTEMAEPIREIYEISWDATLDHEAAKNIDIMDNIHINHVINPTTSIDRKYGVIGIKHEINYDEWLVTYVVRNYDYQATSIPNPVIHISPESGGAEVDFTFSYTHPHPELITAQSWDFDDGFTSTDPTSVVNYIVNGTKTITLTVTTIYGYTKTTSVELEVGIAPPIAAFTYSIDTNNVYTFAFTGSGLGQTYWDFGDGTSSTDTNPSKIYLTAATRTVTLTVSNSFGVDVESQTFLTSAVSIIPVRYVRFRWGRSGVNQNYYRNDFAGQKAWGGDNWRYHSLKFYDTANAQLGAGYTLNDYKDVNGFFTTTPTTLDEYGRTQITPISEIQDKLKNTAGIYPVAWAAGNIDNDGSLINDDRQVKIITTFDLGTNYFSFKEPRISVATQSGAAIVSNNAYRNILVDVSYDNTNWKYIGYLGFANGATTSTFNPVATAPFTFSNTSAPLVDYNWTPVRYIRLDFNAPTPSSNYYWMIRKILPVCGMGYKPDSSPYGFTSVAPFPKDNYFGYGGINLSTRTGSDLTLSAINSSGVNLITKTYTNYPQMSGTISQSIINPGTSGITAWNNVDATITANGQTKDGLTWQETTGEKTFIYDLGQIEYKFNGLWIELGKFTTDGFNEFNVMDGGYNVTISLSIDNINWNTIGTYSMNYTNAGPKYIQSVAWIRTTPYAGDPDTETYEHQYYWTPVHSASTWQEVNHLGLPNGIITN